MLTHKQWEGGGGGGGGKRAIPPTLLLLDNACKEKIKIL